MEEITFNYMKLYTPTFNLLKVPNTQVMNNRILNLTYEGFIKYTFFSFQTRVKVVNTYFTWYFPVNREVLCRRG